MTLRTLPTARVAPSNISPWEGTPVNGSPWTQQQLQVLATDRGGRTDFPSRPVKLQMPAPTLSSPPPEPYFVDCPIIARTRSGKRVLIVTPRGHKIWVNADG